MFKKLDKLIIKAFIGPFVATFFITVFVLVIQFFWLYIDDFVGKGLSINILLKFIWFQSATLVPLALPLAVLLSSIMTFGNLGESFELVAIKSAGISLLRFMRPLLMVVFFLCGIAFLFSSYIMPVANLKSRTLLSDIVFAKPIFNLREGVFYDEINGFAIKVGKKENDSIVHNVIIYEQGNPLQDNIIIAESGVMRTSENKRYLEFYLKNGWRYQERGDGLTNNTEFIRLGFKQYKKQFDLSTLGIKLSEDSLHRSHRKMQSIHQLNKAIDSIQVQVDRIKARVKQEVFGTLRFSNMLDSNLIPAETKNTDTVRSFDEILPDSARDFIDQRAASYANVIKINNDIALSEYTNWQKELRLHKMEWHRKLTLSIACFIFFIIGAPLGSIIRKGGLGTPLIIAIVFFLAFFFLNTMGEKFAKENALTPFSGMWLATLILAPIGGFLTYKAMIDSQLFNKESYFRFGRKIRKLFGKN